jgi:ABC-2 type transport system permease protein
MNPLVIARLITAEVRAYLREPVAVFWTFLFPVLLLVVLMRIYGSPDTAFLRGELYVVDSDQTAASQRYVQFLERGLSQVPRVKLPVRSEAPPERPPSHADDIRLVLEIPAGFERRFQASEETHLAMTYTADAMGLADALAGIVDGVNDKFNLVHVQAGPRARISYARNAPHGAGTSPDNGLVAGLLGMSIVAMSLFGFASVIVGTRARGGFKTAQVWPLSRFEYLAGFTISRLAVALVFCTGFLLLADFMYELPVEYTPLRVAAYLLLVLLAAIAFLGLGLVAVSRTSSPAVGNAICNLIYLPLIFLGDVFFRADLGIPLLDDLRRSLPLSVFVRGVEGVLFQDELTLSVSTVALLATWGVGSLAAAAVLFKWHRE